MLVDLFVIRHVVVHFLVSHCVHDMLEVLLINLVVLQRNVLLFAGVLELLLSELLLQEQLLLGLLGLGLLKALLLLLLLYHLLLLKE